MMKKNLLHKRVLAGAIAAVMLCMPLSVSAAQTTQKTSIEQQSKAAVSYTVSFQANKGAEVSETLTCTKGTAYGTLPKTTRDGYKFKGWYTKKKGGTKVTAKTIFNKTKDQVLYAHWKKQQTADADETQNQELAEAPDMDTSVPADETPTETDTETVPENVTETICTSSALTAYTAGTSVAYRQNDYSGFLVLKNFKPDYLFCQYDYDRFIGTNGKNGGCTATADAMLASIYMDKVFSPNDEGWVYGVGAAWTNSDVASGSKSYSVVQQCQAVYDFLNEGKPVLIRVIGHSVTAIGVRDGIAREDITPADILVADPADAKVKCANEMSWRVMTNANGWGLRIPKASLTPAT